MLRAAFHSSYSSEKAGFSYSATSNALASAPGFAFGFAFCGPTFPLLRSRISTSIIRISMSFIVGGTGIPLAASSSSTASVSSAWHAWNSSATTGSL